MSQSKAGSDIAIGRHAGRDVKQLWPAARLVLIGAAILAAAILVIGILLVEAGVL